MHVEAVRGSSAVARAPQRAASHPCQGPASRPCASRQLAGCGRRGLAQPRRPRAVGGGAGVATTAPAAAAEPTEAALPELPPLDASYEETCAFAEFANWAIPGRLLLGRYPYVEPARVRSHDQGEAQLKRVMEAGVTTFVCLQEEIPAQEGMRIGGQGGFLPYRPTVQLLAAGMSGPPSLEEVAALRTPELDRYLPPRRVHTPGGRAAAAADALADARRRRYRVEPDYLHCPIVDLGLPDDESLGALLDVLAAKLRTPGSPGIYVHCWGGRGRAGTVGACLLAKLYGISAEEALVRVQRSFDTRKDEGRRSPETDEQHAYVARYIAQMQQQQ